MEASVYQLSSLKPHIKNGEKEDRQESNIIDQKKRNNLNSKPYSLKMVAYRLVVQWLQCRAPNAGGLASIPIQKTGSCMLQ